MSFLKKALGTVGIGAVAVDTVIDAHAVCRDTCVRGRIIITGGMAQQTIKSLEIAHCCNYQRVLSSETSEGEIVSRMVSEVCELSRFCIADNFVIGEGEVKAFPFELPLHISTPLTIGKTENWLETDLDIDFALDKNDRDIFSVLPDALSGAFFNTLETLGFSLTEVACEASSQADIDVPFVQAFVMKPTTGDYHSKLDEVAFFFVVDSTGVDVLLEIDRRGRGILGVIAHVLDTDETHHQLRITQDGVNALDDVVDHLLAETTD
ncbi:Sporulation-control protein spo0M [BD1-7 clade bacterium]|uniref:Sporulation-control protein spo0M n=1 Tax=BD1-7 clade bacterium TaxID=2029982 RepID=A0A5S9PZJ6_9GAMM|nr:Sporulation-control protein spo0M [BD1-7 clade bacterium]